MLIDTHAHLDDARFADDLPAVLERAVAAGVGRILTIGVDLPTSRAAVALAGKYPMLAAVVGIQPNHVAEAGADDFAAIVELATAPGVVAIGETGLDRYWDKAPFDLQEEYFVRHLRLCRSVNKPVVIHCREAEPDTVRVLRAEFAASGPIRGVMHSCVASPASVAEFLEMGLHISLAGMLTYKNADDVRTMAKGVPLDRLLVETDSPYLAPVPVRGKRNEPANVKHTAACLAAVKGISLEELAEQTTRNARALFGL